MLIRRVKLFNKVNRQFLSLLNEDEDIKDVSIVKTQAWMRSLLFKDMKNIYHIKSISIKGYPINSASELITEIFVWTNTFGFELLLNYGVFDYVIYRWSIVSVVDEAYKKTLKTEDGFYKWTDRYKHEITPLINLITKYT